MFTISGKSPSGVRTPAVVDENGMQGTHFADKATKFANATEAMRAFARATILRCARDFGYERNHERVEETLAALDALDIEINDLNGGVA